MFEKNEKLRDIFNFLYELGLMKASKELMKSWGLNEEPLRLKTAYILPHQPTFPLRAYDKRNPGHPWTPQACSCNLAAQS